MVEWFKDTKTRDLGTGWHWHIFDFETSCICSKWNLLDFPFQVSFFDVHILTSSFCISFAVGLVYTHSLDSFINLHTLCLDALGHVAGIADFQYDFQLGNTWKALRPTSGRCGVALLHGR